MGGIASGEDAAEFLVAGARAVEVGTASFWDPAATARIIIQLRDFLKSQGITDVNELVGTLKL
jgi:dihydroorotate dehydrogenase (NAD+) catalytic subunit